MGKRIARASALTIVLFQLSYATGIASAGFFDWLVGNNSISITVSEPSTDEIYSDQRIWDQIELNSRARSDLTVIKTYEVRATGYSSTPDQTDDSPFITASGTRVRDGIVATNMLPFGTKIRIPEIYGDKIFVVEDRMNRRYWMNVDIWFPNRNSALTFGSQRVTIEVIEES